jgi:broad specificity phosphatase PhoE
MSLLLAAQALGAFCALFAAAAAVTPYPANMLRKTRWNLFTTYYFFVSKDQKGKNVARKPLVVTRPGQRIHVVFVRHGESVWNSLFNRFGAAWPVRMLTACAKSAVLFLTSPNDSVIIDSPLSGKGEQQAKDLAAAVRREGCKMPSDPKNSVVVCSNLRRAMATAAVGLGPRITTTREKIVVDSSLQEGSRNADAHSFMTTPGRLSDAPVLSYDSAAALGKIFDPSYNDGNKAMNSNVYDRIDTFALRLFGEAPAHPAFSVAAGSGVRPTNVVVVGHSLYFRNFFGRFLPRSSTHVSKVKKMQNCAAVAFDIVADGEGIVSIDEQSIEPLHLGFSK